MGDYVTDLGFVKKRQDEIIADLTALYKNIYGTDVQLGEGSIPEQEIKILSEVIADNWDLAEEVYNQFLASFVTGTPQDFLYALNGITRKPASASTVTLTVTGTPSTSVLAGFQASTEAGLTFETTADATIELGGTVDIPSECTVDGANLAPAGTVTKIVTSLANVSAVTNNADAIAGNVKEVDGIFRLRQSLSTGKSGQNSVDSAFGQLSDLDDVIKVRVYQNRKISPVDPSTGLPINSWMAIVYGGDDNDIADIVWKNTVTQSVGNTTIVITDGQGFLQNVEFERPVLVPVYMDISITKNGSYPAGGDTQIRQNIVDYSLGLLKAETNFIGFNIGEDVLISRIYPPVNLVQGHEITNLEIGLDFGSLSPANIDIDFNEISTYDISRIKINGALP